MEALELLALELYIGDWDWGCGNEIFIGNRKYKANMYTPALQSHTWIGQNKGQQKKKKICYIAKPPSIRWTTPGTTVLHLLQICLWVADLCWKPPVCFPQATKQMTNTNLITLPFCQNNDDGFQIIFCHFLQPVSSIKNPHLPPFPHSVVKLILTSCYSLLSSTSLRDTAPTKPACTLPNLHTFTYLLVDVSGYVGLPLV